MNRMDSCEEEEMLLVKVMGKVRYLIAVQIE